MSKLEAIRPPSDERPRRVETPDQGATLDLPILPAGIDLSDADLEVKVKRVVLKAADVSDASFTGRIREGRMTPSPFAANIARVPFSGAVALDLRGTVPEASLWVAANDVDVGRLLRDFKIVEDLDAAVESLRVQLIGRGSRLGEMLEKSALEVNLDGGHLTMRDVKGKPFHRGRAQDRCGEFASREAGEPHAGRRDRCDARRDPGLSGTLVRDAVRSSTRLKVGPSSTRPPRRQRRAGSAARREARPGRQPGRHVQHVRHKHENLKLGRATRWRRARVIRCPS